MYKIYINETPLFLTEKGKTPDELSGLSNILKAPYIGKPKFLLNYIDLLEKSQHYDAVHLFSDNYDQLKSDFKSNFKQLDAAGGLVYNKAGKLLFIFRRGFWDLPKGKIDNGEKKKAAAIREVQEETGLVNVEIIHKLIETRHTYRNRKGKRIIKKTYWYKMTTTDTELTPQLEEDIEQAVWMSLDEFNAQDRVVYKNILEVLNA